MRLTLLTALTISLAACGPNNECQSASECNGLQCLATENGNVCEQESIPFGIETLTINGHEITNDDQYIHVIEPGDNTLTIEVIPFGGSGVTCAGTKDDDNLNISEPIACDTRSNCFGSYSFTCSRSTEVSDPRTFEVFVIEQTPFAPSTKRPLQLSFALHTQVELTNIFSTHPYKTRVH